MNKKLDLSKNVYELSKEFPEFIEIMAENGFSEIKSPIALNSMGKIMTIEKGDKIKGIDLESLLNKFRKRGFEIENGNIANERELEKNNDKEMKSSENNVVAKSNSLFVNKKDVEDRKKRFELLKSYILRLSNGEEIEEVKKDFVKNFKNVEASEIAMAEQEIIKGGVAISDVQRLCDVHSALFHGSTKEEKIKNADEATHKSIKDSDVKLVSQEINKDNEKDSLLSQVANIKGHPINTLIFENEEIDKRIDEIFDALELDKSREEIIPLINKLRDANTHYAKKGDLIYPILNVDYDFSGPSNVMWGVDNEIRDELRLLATSKYTLDSFNDRLKKTINRAKEMIYKENNILYPLVLEKFSLTDIMKMYFEFKNYEKIKNVTYDTWEEAENKRSELKSNNNKNSNLADEISIGSGSMNKEQLEAVLNTIPMELTFVDDKNINKYFNDGGKLFKRPDTAIGREVFNCHPPKAQAVVMAVIEDLRQGKKDSVDVWMNKNGIDVEIRYMAVRNKEGKFLGTLECVQEMNDIKKHFNK